MQISQIVLYSKDGRIRTVDFKLGAVNIITGGSNRGKSALIAIVDYCLGSGECAVPAGAIPAAVSWYGLLLQFENQRVFVARAAPARGVKSNADVYFEAGATITPPPFSTLVQNATPDGVVSFLSSAVGMPANSSEPRPGDTRRPIQATLRHALALVFQRQDEIASPRLLFHGQSDAYVAQAIKDTLPFFLGAAGDDRLARRAEFRRAQERARELETAIAGRETRGRDRDARVRQLLLEAAAVGLLTPDQVSDGTHGVEALRSLSNWSPGQRNDPTPDATLLRRHQKNYEDLTAHYTQVEADLELARAFEGHREGFASEVGEQGARLASIGLFQSTAGAPGACPLCDRPLESTVPAVEEIQGALGELAKQLEGANRLRPRLKTYLEERERELARLREARADARRRVDDLLAQSNALRGAAALDDRRSRTIGRISSLLEGLEELEQRDDLERELQTVTTRLDALRAELSTEEIQAKLDSTSNRIGIEMSRWAKDLTLEYSQNPLRIDLRHMTVVADADEGPVPMDRMGGGKNWVGYHLLAHFGLHQWFVTQQRPTPRFLMLDQPTQVYYPAERYEEADVKTLTDEDRDAVQGMFNLIFTVVEELAPRFQVIVTDHADLTSDKRFQKAIVERWRGDVKLVPIDWLSEGTVTA
jgi:hypothetical protein